MGRLSLSSATSAFGGISIGTGLAQAAYTVAQRAAREIFEAGTFQALSGAIAYPEINALFPSPGPDQN